MSVVSTLVRLCSQGLAIAILLFAAGLLWLFIGAPVAALLNAPNDRIAEATRLLKAYQSRGSARSQLENLAKTVRAREAALPGLASGANAALVAAQMQSDMKSIIESATGNLRSTANLSPTRIGKYERIAVRFDILLPMDHLADALYAIDQHSPYLFLDDVEVTAPQSAANDPAHPAVLQIQWTAMTFGWAGGK